MKNSILTHKIIPILAIFVVCFFSIFITNVNATDSIITTTLPSINDIVSENDIWFVYCGPVSGSYSLFLYDGHISYIGNNKVLHHSPENSHIIIDYESSDNYCIRFCCGSNYRGYDLIDNVWTLRSTSDLSSLNIIFSSDILPNICASNIDIYNNEQLLGNSDLVFQESPTLSTLKGINFRPMVWETMKTTILGYLKYLVVLVVSLTAFWKGWKFLSMQLKKA